MTKSTLYCFRIARIGVLTSLLMIGAIGLAADDELRYQLRADRYEGIKPKPVAGFDIELLSAHVDYRDRSQPLGEQLHARFYLPKPGEVYIVVRELDYLHFYWLDNVKPATPWRAGFDNVFGWPTGDVIKRLPSPPLRVSDLGVVARLDRADPGAVERVAPVVLYQSQFPERVNAYVFHFRLREEAELKANIFRQGETSPVTSWDAWRQRGGRPFSVKWDVVSPPAAEGAYRLVLSGYLVSTNDPVRQEVEFYHRPTIDVNGN